MSGFSRRGLLVVCGAVVAATAPSVWAIPSIRSASDTIDDATITLRVRAQTILGDARSYCQVRIRVVDDDVALRTNDKVYLWVYEDDIAGDDLIWDHSFSVTSAEASAGLLDRTFDCAANFGDDIGDEAEYYAEARVEKDACGTFCRWDRPETSNIAVPEVYDDGAEQDDSDTTAKGLPLGTTRDRIGRDQDWFHFELGGPATTELEALHTPSVGRLDVELYDDTSSRIASGSALTGSTRIYLSTLPAGEYTVRISPRVSNDYAFYDFEFLITPLATDCDPGEVEVQSCGNCGTRQRECTNLGRWTTFTSCRETGECAPGSELAESCGLCGLRRTICTEECAWSVGECVDEGVCAPGDYEETSEGCPAETIRSHTCNDSCLWDEWTECGGTECEDGDEELCYTGPQGARGIGACLEGSRICEGGLWANCKGDVLPTAEDCDDGRDNDCDGTTDGADPSCVVALGVLGDPCLVDGQCEEPMTCVGSPDTPVFTGGYCSVVDCVGSSECGLNGVCGLIFEHRYCLVECVDDSDCREQYRCHNFGDLDACVPRCDENADCPGNEICDRPTGRCIPPPEPVEEGAEVPDQPDAGGPDIGPDLAGDPDTPDAGGGGVDLGGVDVGPDATRVDVGGASDEADTPSSPTLEGKSACGCSARPAGRSAGSYLGLLALATGLALIRRRRRG